MSSLLLWITICVLIDLFMQSDVLMCLWFGHTVAGPSEVALMAADGETALDSKCFSKRGVDRERERDRERE